MVDMLVSLAVGPPPDTNGHGDYIGRRARAAAEPAQRSLAAVAVRMRALALLTRSRAATRGDGDRAMRTAFGTAFALNLNAKQVCWCNM